jgi:hypothetical protein
MRPVLFALLLPAVAVAAPVPKAKDAGKLLVSTSDGKVTLMNPDGSEAKVVAEAAEGERLVQAKLSPDGTRVVYAVRPNATKLDAVLHVREVGGGKAKEVFKLQHLSRVFWAADGKAVVASGLDVEKGNQPAANRHECWASWQVDTATGQPTPLDAKGQYRAWGWSADGKVLLCVRTFDLRAVGKGVQAPKIETVRTQPDKFAPEVVIPAEVDQVPLAALPDGKRWVLKTTNDGLAVYSAAGGLKAWADFEKTFVVCVAPSPDGKRVAVGTQPKLVTADPDGGDRKTVWEPKANIVDIDWR